MPEGQRPGKGTGPAACAPDVVSCESSPWHKLRWPRRFRALGPASWKFEGLKFLKVLLAFGAASIRKKLDDRLTLSDLAEQTPFSRPNFLRPPPSTCFFVHKYKAWASQELPPFRTERPSQTVIWVGLDGSLEVSTVSVRGRSRDAPPLCKDFHLRAPGNLLPSLASARLLSHGLAVQCEV